MVRLMLSALLYILPAAVYSILAFKSSMRSKFSGKRVTVASQAQAAPKCHPFDKLFWICSDDDDAVVWCTLRNY